MSSDVKPPDGLRASCYGYSPGKTWWKFWIARNGSLILCGTEASAKSIKRLIAKYRPDDGLRVRWVS